MKFDYKGIFGFDISRWQDDVTTPTKKNDFNKMKSYGASFCISKAGQYNFQDRDFTYNFAETRKAGLARASYWFCDFRSRGKEQAQAYWNFLLKNGYDGEICFADYEAGAWSDWNELYNFIFEFQRISQLPNHKIGIYTGYYFWLENMPKTELERSYFKEFPLWLAYYTNDVSFVKVPKPWVESELILWQAGTPAIGREVGVESREIDYNEFQGDTERFLKYFGSIIVTPPPFETPTSELILNYGNKKISYKKGV